MDGEVQDQEPPLVDEEQLQRQRQEEEEERKRIEAAQQLERDLEQAAATVRFQRAVVKDVVSHHSSSILSKEDPEVPHDAALEALAKSAFAASAGDGALSAEVKEVIAVLGNCGFKYATAELPVEVQEAWHAYVGKQIRNIIILQRRDAVSPRNTTRLNEGEFLQLVQRVQAPPYYFGQRLRKLVARGQLADALVLVLRGCNPNTSDGEGLSSLHYACEYDRSHLVEALHNLVGQDLVLNGQDKYGWTPLHSACHHGKQSCVALLLRLGARVLVKNKQGKTPLHLAAGQGRSDIVDLLVEHEPEALNVEDSMGLSALHEAAVRGHRAVCTALRAKGAVVGKDRLGYTAMDYLDGAALGQAPKEKEREKGR